LKTTSDDWISINNVYQETNSRSENNRI